MKFSFVEENPPSFVDNKEAIIPSKKLSQTRVNLIGTRDWATPHRWNVSFSWIKKIVLGGTDDKMTYVDSCV